MNMLNSESGLLFGSGKSITPGLFGARSVLKPNNPPIWMEAKGVQKQLSESTDVIRAVADFIRARTRMTGAQKLPILLPVLGVNLLKATFADDRIIGISGCDSDGASAGIVLSRSIDPVVANFELAVALGQIIFLDSGRFYTRAMPRENEKMQDLIRLGEPMDKADVETTLNFGLELTMPTDVLVRLLGTHSIEKVAELLQVPISVIPMRLEQMAAQV